MRVGRDAGNYRLENLVFRRDSPAADEESAVVAGAHAGVAALKNKVKSGMLALAKAEKEMLHHDVSSGGYAAIVGAGRVTFLNCTFTGPCGGILVTGDGAESLIFGCRFSGAPAGMAAVHIEERARARVRRCIFDKCLGMGVQVVKSECTVDDNAFTEMFNYSVQYALNSAGTVRGNTFVCGRKANVAVSGMYERYYLSLSLSLSLSQTHTHKHTQGALRRSSSATLSRKATPPACSYSTAGSRALRRMSFPSACWRRSKFVTKALTPWSSCACSRVACGAENACVPGVCARCQVRLGFQDAGHASRCCWRASNADT